MAEEISAADFINNLDVNKLPDNPAAHGMKAADVKAVYFGPIIVGLKKLLAELKAEAERLGGEIESESNERSNKDEKLSELINSLDEKIQILNGDELQYGSIDNKIYQLSSNLGDSIASESGTRASEDEKIRSELESTEDAIYKKLKDDYDILTGYIDDVSKAAVTKPSYDPDTGVMTFKSLSGNDLGAIDLIVLSLLENVELVDGQMIFTFKTEEKGVISTRTISLDIGDLTLPAWVTDISHATEKELLTPPTTQAVRTALRNIPDHSDTVANLSNNVSNALTSISNINKLLGTSLPAAGQGYVNVIAWLTQVNGLLEGKLGITPFNRSDVGRMLTVNYDGGFAVGDYPSDIGGGGSDGLSQDEIETIVNNAIESERAAREAAFSDLDSAIAAEYSARVAEFNSVRASAVGVPTYDVNTGVMTFKTLNNGTTLTIDLPIEKIVDNVTLSADGKSFVFTFHNSDPITLPVGNITLPAWVTDIENATGENLLIPPNTEAVRNYIIAKMNAEATARSEADAALDKRIDDVKLTAENAASNANLAAANGVGAPHLEGSDLVFPDFYGSEKSRITLPAGGSGGSSGGDSCTCYDVPLQRVEWNNRDMWYTGDDTLEYDFTYTPISDNLMKAVIHVQPPTEWYCGGFPSLVLKSEPPFGLNDEPWGGPYIEAANIYYDIRKVSGYSSDDLSISLNKEYPNQMFFYNNSYYFDMNNWFIEITVDINTREIWVVANEMITSY